MSARNTLWTYFLHAAGWTLLLWLPYLFSFRKAVRFDHLWTSPQDFKNLISWVLLIRALPESIGLFRSGWPAGIEPGPPLPGRDA